MRVVELLTALALLMPVSGVASAAVGSPAPSPEDVHRTRETEFTLGGAHAVASLAGPAGLQADEDRVAAAAACQSYPFDIFPDIPPPHPLVAGTVGGQCYSLDPYAAGETLNVTVTPDPDGHPSELRDPTKQVAFAVGYDGDDDGCVGCSSADTLWRAEDSIAVPVLDGEPTLAVFVYGLAADVDRTGPPSDVATGLVGEIRIQPGEVTARTCTPGAEDPADRCGVGLGDLAPHLCVPDCQAIVEEP